MAFCQENQLSQFTCVVHQFASISTFPTRLIEYPAKKRLLKLERLGIKGFLSAWFRCYLNVRRHRIWIDNEASDFLPVTSGVPQGYILGPCSS